MRRIEPIKAIFYLGICVLVFALGISIWIVHTQEIKRRQQIREIQRAIALQEAMALLLGAERVYYTHECWYADFEGDSWFAIKASKDLQNWETVYNITKG